MMMSKIALKQKGNILELYKRLTKTSYSYSTDDTSEAIVCQVAEIAYKFNVAAYYSLYRIRIYCS